MGEKKTFGRKIFGMVLMFLLLLGCAPEFPAIEVRAEEQTEFIFENGRTYLNEDWECKEHVDVLEEGEPNHYCDVCGEHMSEQCEKESIDEDGDHWCDVCWNLIKKLCTDADNNHICDLEICQNAMDWLCEDSETDEDHLCDVCQEILSECITEDGDNKCDVCGKCVHEFQYTSNGDGTHGVNCVFECDFEVIEYCDAGDEWFFNSEEHWAKCNLCNDIVASSKKAHQFKMHICSGIEKDITIDGITYKAEEYHMGFCDDCCGYEIPVKHIDADSDGVCDGCDSDNITVAVHQWSYVADEENASITAMCQGCDACAAAEEAATVTMTLSLNDEITYQYNKYAPFYPLLLTTTDIYGEMITVPEVWYEQQVLETNENGEEVIAWMELGCDVPENAGTYRGSFSMGEGEQAVTVMLEYTVKPILLNSGAFDLEIEEFIYDGTEKYPEHNTVELILVEGFDYIVVRPENMIDAGEKEVIFIGINNYSGEAFATYTILPKEVTEPVFDGLLSSYEWQDGFVLEPTFMLKDGDTVISDGEYTVEYKNNAGIGMATVVVTDIEGGNYIISGTQSFEIIAHEHTFATEWSKNRIAHWQECIKENCRATREKEEHFDTDNDGVCDVCDCELSAEEVTDFVSRLYKVVLDREADEAGLAEWTGYLVDGVYTGAEVAKGFIMSDEFLNKDMTNEEFVRILYSAFFGREADASGLTFWVDYLNQGYRKSFVFAGFANSDEFTALCEGYGVAAGSVPVTISEQQPNLSDADYNIWLFVERMYTEVLDRPADMAGIQEWVGLLKAGTWTGAEVASGFILSKEFQAKEMTNEEYVQIMYKAFFGREADPSGLETWINALETSYTKEYVFAGFANSNEFGVLCANYGILQGSVEVPEK